MAKEDCIEMEGTEEQSTKEHTGSKNMSLGQAQKNITDKRTLRQKTTTTFTTI